MVYVLTSAAVLLLLATCLPWLRLTHWTVRIFDFPRLQIATLAGCLLVVALIDLAAAGDGGWQLPVILIALGVCIAQGMLMYPYTRFASRQMLDVEELDPARRLTLLNANVLMTNRNSGALIEMVRRRQPDLLVTLESDAWWQAELDRAFADDYPHRVAVPLDNLYGMHLYSRRPLIQPRVRWLIQGDIPSILTQVELESGERVTLFVLHPRPPSPTESEESLWRDAELLLVAQEIAAEHCHCLLVGDLNDVAWSRTTKLFSNVSGLLDPRRGRGAFATFHAHWPMLRWPLDHLFASREFRLAEIERMGDIGSDHFPLFVSLVYAPQDKAQQPRPTANAEEIEEAQRTVAEAQAAAQDVPKGTSAAS